MKLLELHNKLLKSGIDGNPVISDKELEEFKDKLTEFLEYADAVNLTANAIINERWSVQTILFNRDAL